jgi:hypothetical protein
VWIIDENAIRVFISYSKDNKKDAQDFKRLFENKEPVIDGKKVVIWTMQIFSASEFASESSISLAIASNVRLMKLR